MEVITKDCSFDNNNFTLNGVLASPDGEGTFPGVLFLHGGGQKNGKNIYTDWMQFLGKRGYCSFAFDFRGVGENCPQSYLFGETTLNQRLSDSIKALETFTKSPVLNREKLAVCGTSMGGHIASRLSVLSKSIKAIILHGAAAYSEESESLKFNNGFSAAIRQELNWVNSPAFIDLANFKGPSIAIYGEFDGDDGKVIPRGIQERYREITSATGGFKTIPNIGHYFLSNPDKNFASEQLYQYSLDFLEKYLK